MRNLRNRLRNLGPEALQAKCQAHTVHGLHVPEGWREEAIEIRFQTAGPSFCRLKLGAEAPGE